MWTITDGFGNQVGTLDDDMVLTATDQDFDEIMRQFEPTRVRGPEDPSLGIDASIHEEVSPEDPDYQAMIIQSIDRLGYRVIPDQAEEMKKKYEGERREGEEKSDFEDAMMSVFDDEIDKIEVVPGTTPAGIQKKVEQILARMEDKLKATVEGHYESMALEGYNTAVNQFEHTKGLVEKATSPVFLSVQGMLVKSPIWEAFANLKLSTSQKFGELITDAFEDPEGFSIQKLRDKMKEEADIEIYRLERIARTEHKTLTQLGRDIGYEKSDPEDTSDYDWTGPPFDPQRSSDLCLDIKTAVAQERSSVGRVSRKRLWEIVKVLSEGTNPRTGKGYNGKNWAWREKGVAHVNCRHIQTRLVSSGL